MNNSKRVCLFKVKFQFTSHFNRCRCYCHSRPHFMVRIPLVEGAGKQNYWPRSAVSFRAAGCRCYLGEAAQPPSAAQSRHDCQNAHVLIPPDRSPSKRNHEARSIGNARSYAFDFTFSPSSTGRRHRLLASRHFAFSRQPPQSFWMPFGDRAAFCQDLFLTSP